MQPDDRYAPCRVHRFGLIVSTLFNVEDHKGAVSPIRTAVTGDALPRVSNMQTGASVEYAPAPNANWYVLRATYGREDKAADTLIDMGHYAYVARRREVRRIDGHLRRRLRPIVPSIVFAYLTDAQAYKAIRETPALAYLSYYYDHFRLATDYRNPPLIVPDGQMRNFILATATQNEHLRLVSKDRCHFRSDDEVLITDGEFRGVRGRVARLAGQQRVVVDLLGQFLIATAYIPTAFLTKR